MRFSVAYRDAAGTSRTVLRTAETATAAAAQIRAEGGLVLAIEEVRGPNDLPGRWNPLWLLPMTGFDVEMGLRQIASMLKSGVSLLVALETTGAQARNPRARHTWRSVRDDVLRGVSFGDALEGRKRRFGELVVRLARVGERSGELDRVLSRAADQLESRRNLRTLLANALVYPILALAMTVGVTAFLVTVVIPRISSFLQANGADLPHLTQLLVDFSEGVATHGATILLVAAGLVAAWFALRVTAGGHELEDAALLRVPVAGRILRLSATAVLARALETMLASGLPLLDALDTGRNLFANRRLRRRLGQAHDAVMRGQSLSSALADAPEFLPMLGRMAAVGEMTGTLAETFGETARFHEAMLAVAIRRFGVLIEPVMICITGTIVGFVYIAFFLAIFSLAGAR